MQMTPLLLALVSLAGQAPAEPRPLVVFETGKGAIEIEVDTARAPLTAANFLKYVDGRFYDGGAINRAVRPDNTTRHDVEIQVIQFQSDPQRRREMFPPVPLERTSVTGLTHGDGTVSMARSGPDTAQASFSIVIGDQPEMNFGGRRNADGQGFAVFGRVVRGMDVVKAIQASPTGQRGAYGTETLEPVIPILRAFRQPAASPHPLDPLTAAEIDTASGIITAEPRFPAGGKFATLVLKEPAKQDVLAWRPGAAVARQAFAMILDRAGNRTFEAVVDVTAKRLVSWLEVQNVQPPVLDAEYDVFVRIVKSDPGWQAAMRKRGVQDLDKVQLDFWATGQVPTQFQRKRLLRAVSYYKGDQTNFYGRPIEGVIALVDMNAEKVVELTDTGVRPLPPPSQEFDMKSTGVREAPKPLTIAQPQGASFTITGQEVRWQKWRFRYVMHPREGLVLQTVGYEDAGRVRPILYRAALSEMAVPYGDSDRNWRWRSAFDVGEYGMGRLASAIEPNTDAPSNATLIDVTYAGDDGKPYTAKNAVGIYERDGGMLWKHYETYSKTNESRRARDLVIFFIATIGNYDYAVNWIFHQDGTLEFDAALTGIMLPKGVAAAKSGAHGAGHLVAPNVVAPHHQHFFNFRLDFDVDGPANAVHELNTTATPAGPDNPSLNGMVMKETMLGREALAQRDLSIATARAWAIVNPSAQNALGSHTSYILVPGVNSIPYIGATSQVRRRAGFINHHFWATRYRDGEMYAGGMYPNQSLGGAGLAKWVADNEPLTNQDVVVWYTMGVTHIPRPEEWPVMPVTHVGFKLIPAGFFARNPALDVPK